MNEEAILNPTQKHWISKDIQSYIEANQKHAKTAIHWFGEY